MKIEISSVADAGTLNKERVVMKATGADDIGDYAIFNCVTQEDRVASGDVPYAYWFMDMEVNAGDFVVLYTKAGTRSEKKNQNGTVSHFFYWGLEQPLWTPGKTPVLVHASEWDFGKPIK